jgi:acyl-CoA hydrolase
VTSPAPTSSEAVLVSALGSLPGSPRVVASGNFAAPTVLLSLLDRVLPTYTLHMLNAQPGIPCRAGVHHETAFVGSGMRLSPDLSYVPCRLSLLPRLFRTTLPPDVAVVHTSRPHQGTVSLGTEVNVLPAAIEEVRRRGGLVIAQMNASMPYTFGDAVVPLEHLDHAIEVDVPLASPATPVLDDASRVIGQRVASRVSDGAVLQTGIGAVPDATLHELTGHRGLAVWSEMFSDGVLALDRAGALDRARPITASFVFGSPELYAWIDRNERVRLSRTETTNDPAMIRRNDNMVSVNTALQVDLFGQANASRIGRVIYSGFGGQTDFVVGAMHSDGGQALVALRSWHPKADRSTIVPLVDEPVTSFQMMAVVTEQGIAEISGRDQRTQARNLIGHAAHPDAREELLEEARALHLVG